MKKHILVIHGPNLNLLGERESNFYGNDSFDSINKEIRDFAESLGLSCEIYQSNIEGEIINKIQAERFNCDGIVANMGAYTHYSYAIREAIADSKKPCIEVHMSNVMGREEFRSKSVIAPVCVGQISGFGKYSYLLAIEGINKLI